MGMNMVAPYCLSFFASSPDRLLRPPSAARPPPPPFCCFFSHLRLARTVALSLQQPRHDASPAPGLPSASRLACFSAASASRFACLRASSCLRFSSCCFCASLSPPPSPLASRSRVALFPAGVGFVSAGARAVAAVLRVGAAWSRRGLGVPVGGSGRRCRRRFSRRRRVRHGGELRLRDHRRRLRQTRREHRRPFPASWARPGLKVSLSQPALARPSPMASAS